MENEPLGIYMRLREQALTYTAESLEGPDEVFGVVMETGYPKGAVTLVSLIDGATSLYFSAGGGVIGAGDHVYVLTRHGILTAVAKEEDLGERRHPPVTIVLRSAGCDRRNP